jgi:DNA-binding transcriptional ArsR family regulator
MPIITPYKAIADDTRRQILDLLRTEALTAGAIAQRVRSRGRNRHLSRPAVSKHLRILRHSRLVSAHKQGREQIYELNAEPLQVVRAWVKEYEVFWDGQLTAFKNYVETTVQKEQQHGSQG